MRAIALLSTYNEERFITGCLEHLVAQGMEVVLIDDGSTDRTVGLAERFLGRGLTDIRSLTRGHDYEWQRILELKEHLAAELEADWFMHVDADEIRLPRPPHATLVEAMSAADGEGYNALDFMEYTFQPTTEAPDHDHPDFQQTMRWYYPYLPFVPHRLTAWKKQPQPVELAWSGGHIVRFPGLKAHPNRLTLKHYLFLSIAHAREKYIQRKYCAREVAYGWHEWRADVTESDLTLPHQAELREVVAGRALDDSNPRATYFIEDLVKSRTATPATA